MSDEAPLVSVVIPTYNYGHVVTEAVESALAQTYPAVEVIVVDDGSTDDTRERLAPYGDRIRYIHQANAGLSAARNTGIRAARGEFIALLDSDDAFHPRKLELQMRYLAERPDVVLVGTRSTTDPDHRYPTPPEPVPAREIPLDRLVITSHFPPSSVVIRRACIDSVGLFDVNLRSTEDRDFWIRVGARFGVAVLDAPLTWYRLHPGSMSRNAEKMAYYDRMVLDKAFAMPELRGRRLLRRKALGLADMSAAYLFAESGRPWEAAKRIARSFALWPVPFRATEVRLPWVRVRLAVRIARMLATHRPQLTESTAAPSPTAG
jgi:glycosyltransferase involved in cell wall biosynthesis